MAQSKATSASSVKKTPAKKKTASGSKAPSAAAKKKAAEQLAVRRVIFAGVLLLLAFIGALSAFRQGGFLIRGYDGIFYALFGLGGDILPPVFLTVALLLIFKRRKKVRLQAICWGMLPLLCGALRHLRAFPRGCGASLFSLLESGKARSTGGLLAGGLAELLRAAFSAGGAKIFCIVVLILCLLCGLHLGPAFVRGLYQRLKPLPEPEEEEAPAPQATPQRRPAPRPVSSVRRSARPSIDIPLDDPVTRCNPDRKKTDSPQNQPDFQREIPPKEAPASLQTPELRPDPADTLAQISELRPDPADPPAVQDKPAPEDSNRDSSAPKVEYPTAPAPESGSDRKPDSPEDASQQTIYLYPPLKLMQPGKGKPAGSKESIRQGGERLVDTLESFGVQARLIDTTDGPAVTRYELLLQRGVKFSKVVNLADDIALALGASGIRVSTIPDKNAVGIEVPNAYQEVVTARDIIGSSAFRNGKSRLSFAVGKDIAGQPVVGDIAKMPHLLIAGTTGSGKSVCINSLLISLLYKSTPDEVRLIMIDPKMIELGVYNGIPHLLIPVVTDPKKAAGALNWAVTEMMRRYQLFAQVGARELKAYNAEMERVIAEGGSGEKLPQVVIVIDELSDLMAVARSEVEEAIIRLAQMARAAGMHLIIATQRPSADVITGLMKTNIPSRIAFAVASGIDSRIILDQTGAEKLLGKGDMLYFPLGIQKPQRVQGCFVTDQEVEEVVAFVKQCGTAEYDQQILEHIEKQSQQAENAAKQDGGYTDEEDPKFDEAVEIVVESGQASVSMLQRHLKLGYSRAARLVDEMEERGIVGPFEGSKPRPVLISRQEWQERMLRKRGD